MRPSSRRGVFIATNWLRLRENKTSGENHSLAREHESQPLQLGAVKWSDAN